MSILIILSILLIVNTCYGTPASTNLIVTRVGPCSDRKKETIRVSEMSLNKHGNEFSLSGEINITEDIENGWIVKATMQKCHDIRNLDTCDFYKATSLVKNGCEGEEDEQAYEIFFKYIIPKLKCPIKAGRYVIKDFPFFNKEDLTTVEFKISTSVFGFTYRLEGFDDDEARVLCVETHMRMIYVREHDWLGNKKIGVYSTAPPPTTDKEAHVEVEE